MSFPTSPVNGATTTVNGITYIYNATNNAWKRQTLTDITVTGNLTVSGNVVQNGENLPSLVTVLTYSLAF